MKLKVFPPRGCDRSVLDSRGWMEMPEGTTVADVLKTIHCSRWKAKLLLVSVNGVRVESFRMPLQDGDVIGFFQPVSGG